MSPLNSNECPWNLAFPNNHCQQLSQIKNTKQLRSVRQTVQSDHGNLRSRTLNRNFRTGPKKARDSDIPTVGCTCAGEIKRDSHFEWLRADGVFRCSDGGFWRFPKTIRESFLLSAISLTRTNSCRRSVSVYTDFFFFKHERVISRPRRVRVDEYCKYLKHSAYSDDRNDSDDDIEHRAHCCAGHDHPREISSANYYHRNYIIVRHCYSVVSAVERL